MRALRLKTVWPFALVGGVVAVACGSDALPCESTQTCQGDTSADGGGGDAQGGNTTSGAGEDSGGNDAGRTGKRGTGGSGTTTDGGTGGAPDMEPPTVESFSPPDGDEDVEPRVEVTATLSEPIDGATVTNTSVTLLGAKGDVSGAVRVDENVITFVPDRPLDLLGTYTFTLAGTIADVAGNTLRTSASAEFNVRDGRWRAHVYPFGKTGSRNVAKFERNALGDVVVGMNEPDVFDTVYGAVYHAAEDRWTPATELRSTPGGRCYVNDLDIDLERRAVVVWGCFTAPAYGWSRFVDDAWGLAGPLGGVGDVGVTTEGAVLAATWEGTNPDLVLQSQDLSTGTVDPAAPYPTLDDAEFVLPVASRDRLALISAKQATGGQELEVRWQVGIGWGAPERLARASDFDPLTFDSDEQGNIMVVWLDGTEIRSRVYDRAQDRWLPEALVTTTTPDATLGKPDLTSGSAILYFKTPAPSPATWAAIYEAGVGWIQDSIVELDDESGDLVAVSMDEAGNALVVWNFDVRHRRYLRDGGWQAPASLVSSSVNSNTLWAAAAPDGTVLVVANDFGWPWAIRFE